MKLREGMITLPLAFEFSGDAMWQDGSKAVAVDIDEAKLLIRLYVVGDGDPAKRMRRTFMVVAGGGLDNVEGYRHLISFMRLSQIWHILVENDGGQTVP